ncbi:KAP family P-loop NTPase fold protein [Methanococcus aeolicus]|uniref:KAP family P-loop NTPase fold protein n=1 Tax=Methanococcus aeolicus TaxID=42879 RepID=UPI0021C67B41|nr:KAP family NTPase [Methanococcus aeolicus]UXM84992.1 KAP family NTPase [Methanococcus aeolicus]
MAGCLVLLSIYPEITALIDIFNKYHIISISILIHILTFILLFVFGYSFTALCWLEAIFNDTYGYISNKKYHSFQTAETVSKNGIDGCFNNISIVVQYSLLLVGSLFLLYHIEFFKSFDGIFLSIMAVVIVIIVIIDIIYCFIFKNMSNKKRMALSIVNPIIWIFIVLLPLYIDGHYWVGVYGGMILFLSFNFYNILSIQNNILIATILKLKPCLKKVFEEKIIDRIITTNNYDHKIDEPIPLTEDIDCFNTLKKVDMIKEGISKNILNSYKIIALYGNWGCGKSSVIKTLMKELDLENKVIQCIKEDYGIKKLTESIKNKLSNEYINKKENFISIKFDAWEYENEENIAYALLNKIIEELERDADVKYGIKAMKNEILKSGAIVLKSVSVNYKIFGFNFENNFNNEKYKEVENLKNGLNKISDVLSKNNKRLIVFIDELDRCERENILKFLASLKLFFTSGDNINYICAVDKKAVKEALEHKYNDGEKAEEYLEKIFNFSFNMPETFSVEKFIKRYGFNDYNAEKLSKFFEAINFKTPRHLKKVLNKYDYLVKIKTSKDIINNNDKLKKLIPDIIRCPHMVQTSKIKLTEYHYYIKKDKKLYNEYLFDTIFILYFIILYEFYYEKYSEIKNMDDKLNNYVMYFRTIGWDELNNNNPHNEAQKTIIEQILKKYIDSNEFNKSFYNLFEKYAFKPYINEEFVFEPYDKNKAHDELEKLWYKNKELLKLINIFTPMINNKKSEYDIYDISLKKIIRPINNWKYVDDEFLNSPDYFNNLDEDSCRQYPYRDKCISDFSAFLDREDMKETEINNGVYHMSKDAIISNLNKYIKQFEYKNNEILIDFCKYLISDKFFEIIEREKGTYNNKDYKFKTLFEMVETLL